MTVVYKSCSLFVGGCWWWRFRLSARWTSMLVVWSIDGWKEGRDELVSFVTFAVVD